MMLPKILSCDCLNGLSSATDVGKDKAVIPVPAQPCNQPHHGLMQLKTHSGETLFLWDLWADLASPSAAQFQGAGTRVTTAA